jgi:hypothetical protein
MMNEFVRYIVPLLIVAVLIVRRSGRAQKVRPGRMWIRPVILLLMAVTALAAGPMPGLLMIAAFVVAAGLGAGLGYLMAHHQHLSIDTDTGHILSRSTTIGTLLILGLFAIRFGAKLVFPELANPGHAGQQVTQATDGMLIFTVSVLISQSIALFNRTRPLVADHAARKAAGQIGQTPAGVEPAGAAQSAAPAPSAQTTK